MTSKKMRVERKFSSVRISCLRNFTLIFLLPLVVFGFRAGAQTHTFKELGGSAVGQTITAEAHSEMHAHQNYISDDVLYRFCNGMTTIGNCQGFQPQAGVILDNGSVTAGVLYGTDMGYWGPPCTGVRAGDGAVANPLECDPPFTVRGQAFMYDTNTHQETVIHQFNSFNGDGWNSVSGLIQDASGNLYGTTYGGGSSATGSNNCMGTGGCGTVFEISPQVGANGPEFGANGPDTVLYSFEGGPQGGTMDGANPAAALIQDTNGNLYGTTEFGGLYQNGGTVFVLCNASAATFVPPCSQSDPPWKEHVIYNFGASGPSDGANPIAGLFIDSGGHLWGTTASGGNYNSSYCWDPTGGNTCGTLFELYQVSGGWTEMSSPYLFCSATDCTDGANPAAGLIEGTVAGYLLGTTEWGGMFHAGTVFALNTANTAADYVLYSFCSQADCSDGANPIAGLVGPDASQTVYGTTSGGGNDTCATSPLTLGGCGTAFKFTNPLQVGSQPQTMYKFCKRSNCTDGISPAAGLTLIGTNAYGSIVAGTTQYGGFGTQTVQPYTLGEGTVFELYPCSLICFLVNPQSMAWANVPVGKLGIAKSVMVTNTGTEAAQISSIEITGEFALAKVKNSCVNGGILAAGATCEIGATFNPTQTGFLTGQITITDKAENSPQTVALSGTGTE